MVKSNNTQGNPYHDDEGKFTSQGNEGSKTGGGNSERAAAMRWFGLEKGGQKFGSTLELASALGWKPSKDHDDVIAAGELVEKVQDKFGEELDFWESVKQNPQAYSDEDLEKFRDINLRIKIFVGAEEYRRLRSEFDKANLDDENVLNEVLKNSLEIPSTVSLTETVGDDDYGYEEEHYKIELDVSPDDVIKYLEYDGALTDKEKQFIREYGAIPEAFVYSNHLEDYDSLSDDEDFVLFIRDRKEGAVQEQMNSYGEGEADREDLEAWWRSTRL